MCECSRGVRTLPPLRSSRLSKSPVDEKLFNKADKACREIGGQRSKSDKTLEEGVEGPLKHAATLHLHRILSVLK